MRPCPDTAGPCHAVRYIHGGMHERHAVQPAEYIVTAERADAVLDDARHFKSSPSRQHWHWVGSSAVGLWRPWRLADRSHLCANYA